MRDQVGEDILNVNHEWYAELKVYEVDKKIGLIAWRHTPICTRYSSNLSPQDVRPKPFFFHVFIATAFTCTIATFFQRCPLKNENVLKRESIKIDKFWRYDLFFFFISVIFHFFIHLMPQQTQQNAATFFSKKPSDLCAIRGSLIQAGFREKKQWPFYGNIFYAEVLKSNFPNDSRECLIGDKIGFSNCI